MRRATTLAALIALLPSMAAAKELYRVDPSKPDGARLTMRDFADCLVFHEFPVRTRNIDAFLAISPMARNADRLGEKLAVPDCLKSKDSSQYIASLTMKPQLLRGALFRSRFEKAFKGKALPAFAPYDATDGWHFPSDDPFAPLQMIGECAVRSNPGGTRAVIEAPVGSPAENEAYRTVIPSLKACLPANNTYKFSRTVLEGLFAEAIYNLSVRASAPTTTKSEG